MANRRQKIVPECASAINQMKYEIAAEFGVPLSQGSTDMDTEFAGELGSVGGANFGQQYFGNLTSRETGSIGGEITKRLVQQAQQTII
ncbi:alpha/beta-type small acid-soluble spore protein [Cohnella panacarvi]|uniref:alpha/beta-type small acid-soluble spore protein n=1 Tax=Cohnella panacarvi TaxID=400776 RepID=UPI00047A2903|nr:alpha/beta-type small acid-soluble spore protein [Cohnella panacarvi]